jgi:hypothetical protein
VAAVTISTRRGNALHPESEDTGQGQVPSGGQATALPPAHRTHEVSASHAERETSL